MKDGAKSVSEPETTGISPPGDARPPYRGETERARQAQRLWAEVSVRKRLRCVRAFRLALVDAQDRICQAVDRDVGKPHEECLVSEVLSLAEECRFLERRAEQILRPRAVSLRLRPVLFWAQRDVTFRRPRGLVAVIGTWNLPMMINSMQVMHALAAGNAVLFKPSEVAPESGRLLAELVARAGFPDGIFHLLPATREAGPQLAEADIDHLVFTGSTAVGRALAGALGQRLVTSTLELSGCDLLLLLEDGDVELAAKGAWFGATVNRGQACVGTRRAFVPRTRLSDFLHVLTPLVEQAEPVPLVLPAQAVEAQRLIADAQSRGARLMRRGDPPPQADGAVQPVALVQESPDSDACREAYFAPLLTVIPYDDVEQVVSWNAECPYGLGASIFTADARRALALAGRLDCGVVYVNDVIIPMGHPATCFGGRGASGWGRTKGSEGLLEMTVPQVVSRVRGRFRPHFDGACAHEFLQPEALSRLIQVRHARSARARLLGAWHLMRLLLQARRRRRSQDSD